MDFKQLTYIITIAEEHNLTKAAERLFVSQSTLSLYLNKLERELGVALFTRNKNRLTITPEGRRICKNSSKDSGTEKRSLQKTENIPRSVFPQHWHLMSDLI